MEGGLNPQPEGAPAYAPDIAALRRMFEQAADLSKNARTEAQKDEDYYHGAQWTDAEKAALADRGQPDNVFNRVRPAVNGTLGVLQQGSTDPRAYPRTPKDEDSADVASKVLRFIADDNQFQAQKIACAQSYLVQGTCAAIIEVDQDLRVVIDGIHYEEFFADPMSRRKDFADARYMGIAKWQYADDVAKQFPDAKDEVERTLEGTFPAIDDTFQDRPKEGARVTTWADKKFRRIMVVELYHREGDRWFRCVFHASGTLAAGESPYLDEKGRPCCPIVAQSCYIDRDNDRYGIVRDMRGPQDEINKRRSKLLHLLNTAQVQAVHEAAMETNAATAADAAAKPNGAIPFGWQRVRNDDIVAGQANLLAESKAELERMGPNPAILGRQGESSSGRAQLVRQQAGLTEQAVVYAGVEAWEVRAYRQMWARVRQFWTEPMYVRVTDDEKAPEFVGINQPKVEANALGAPVQTGVENQVGAMDVDIMLDSVPDTANVQQEQFQTLAEMAKMYPQQVTFEDLLALSTMPGKREVLERMRARREQAPQAEQEAVARREQIAVAGAIADIEKTRSETELNAAKTAATYSDARTQAAEAMVEVAQPVAGDFTGEPHGQA